MSRAAAPARVAAAALLATVLLASLTPVAAQKMGHGSAADPGIIAEGPVRAWFSNGPDAKRATASVVLLEGQATRVWLHVVALTEPVDDVVNLTAGGATLDVSEAPVNLAEGQHVAIPVRVTPDDPASGSGGEGADPRDSVGTVSLQATFPGLERGDGAPLAFADSAHVIQPVSVSLVAPQAVGSRGVAHAGWFDEPEFRARVTNRGAAETTPFNVTLTTNHGQVLESVEVAPLAPGASREVSLGAHGVEASERPGLPGGRMHHGYSDAVAFRVATEAPGGPLVEAHSFTVSGERVNDLTPARVLVEFHQGLTAFVESTGLTLAEPSHVTVVVANYGDRAESRVTVEVALRPEPAAYYGPGTFVKESRTLALEPGQLERVNVTFTPRVAGRYHVEVMTLFSDYRSGHGDILEVPTPVTANALDTVVHRLGVGDTARATFALSSSEDLGDVTVGVAVAPADHSGLRGNDVAFARFTTLDDLLKVDVTPTSATLGANDTVWVNATIEGKAAGRYNVIPYVYTDGVYYPAHSVGAILDEDDYDSEGHLASDAYRHRSGNHVTVLVQGAAGSLGQLWLPLGAVLAAFGGHRAYRRARVR